MLLKEPNQENCQLSAQKVSAIYFHVCECPSQLFCSTLRRHETLSGAKNRASCFILETRHGTHGNNRSAKIMHCLVKANGATQLDQKQGMALHRKYYCSFGGVYSGMLRDVELTDLFDMFHDESCADALIQVFCSTRGVPESIDADSRFISCRMSFALLLGTVKDRQTLGQVSCLGGAAIMARLEAIKHISRYIRFHWTGARLSDLNGLVAEGKNPDEIARFSHITVEEVQNGWTKLAARVPRVA
jgi:hypothetical protein